MADKITPKVLTSGFASIAALNENFSDIAIELNDKVLYRNTSEPNQMEVDLDMNSNKLINLSTPQNSTDAVRLQDLVDGVATTDTVLPLPTGKDGKYLGASGGLFVFQDTSNLEWVQAGTGALPRNVQNKLRDVVSVLDFGAVGDGSTDDTAAFQAAADFLSSGGTIHIPRTSSFYKLTTVTISNDGITFKAERGAHLKWPVLGADTFGFSVEANGFEYSGGKMEGPLSGVHVSAENGFSSIGASTSSRFSGFKVTNVEIFNFGGRGIELKFVDDITVEYNLIHDCGNHGALFKSCNNGSFFKNAVHTITPGLSGNMYGMSLSHTSTGFDVDQTTNPFCRGWDVSSNEVYNIPVWTGLDAHGVWNCTVTNNRIHACKQGIEMGVSSGDATNFAGGNLTISSNIVNASNRDGSVSGAEHLSRGISCRGGSSTKNINVTLSDNTIEGYGVKDDNVNASIYALFCDGIQLDNNIIREWQGNAIRIDTSSGSASNNNIHGLTADDTIGILFRWDSGTEKFSFIGNQHNSSDTGFPARIGVDVGAASHVRMFASGNDFSECSVSRVNPTTGVKALWKGTDFGNIMKSTDTATPDISALGGANGVVIFDHTTPTTVTDFLNAVQGQELTLINVNTNATTVSRTGDMQLDGAVNQVLAVNETIRLTRYSTNWYQSSKRSVNS